jgi:hypothetical protein
MDRRLLDQGGSGQDGQQSIYRLGETSGTPYLTIEKSISRQQAGNVGVCVKASSCNQLRRAELHGGFEFSAVGKTATKM